MGSQPSAGPYTVPREADGESRGLVISGGCRCGRCPRRRESRSPGTAGGARWCLVGGAGGRCGGHRAGGRGRGDPRGALGRRPGVGSVRRSRLPGLRRPGAIRPRGRRGSGTRCNRATSGGTIGNGSAAPGSTTNSASHNARSARWSTTESIREDNVRSATPWMIFRTSHPKDHQESRSSCNSHLVRFPTRTEHLKSEQRRGRGLQVVPRYEGHAAREVRVL